SGVGEGGDLGPGADSEGNRSRLGVDRERVRGLPRLQGLPVQGVLGGLLRQGLPRAARRFVGGIADRRQEDVPQLGPARAAPDIQWGETCSRLTCGYRLRPSARCARTYSTA